MLRYICTLALLIPLFSHAQNERSLSPYFMVNVDSGEAIPDFPLKLTNADVQITGVIADVTVTQVYINHSTRPLEAIYVFPGSTSAAVYAMEMQIGRRTITAEIAEKDQARAQYDQAKQDGKTASLLEQQRPDIFTMNVANVMPGDSIIVRMSYTERLVPTSGVYEFVYPTVVGPRYTGRGVTVASANNDSGAGRSTEGIPYTKKDVKPTYDFGITINIASGIPFEFIRSTSHKVLLSFGKENTAAVLLDTSETNGGNRDFVLQYRFAGGKIETGLQLYEGKDENFFMLMVQPPKRVPLDSIPPREYIFVMDVSGSMGGYPIETSKTLLRNLVSGLRPSDKFNVVQFAGGAALLSEESLEATRANIDSALAFISRPQGSGGTELNAAMRTAMFIPRSAGFSRSIVIVTDGLISAEASVLKSMRTHLDSANVFAFGIGTGVNRYLIEAMAFTGNGEPFVVTKAQEADSAAERFRRYVSSPVLTNIKVQYNGFDVYDNEPTAVPDLFADRPLVITGKYRGKPSGKILITGNTGAGPYVKELRVDSVRPDRHNKAIRLLWARDRVKYLSYLDDPGSSNFYNYGSRDTSARSEIIELGLKYGILTNYTSFIAIDRRVRNEEGLNDSTVVEPLPLPQGLENSALGMYGYMSIKNVVSMGGVVDISACTFSSVSACVILPSRPVFPGNAMSTQDPAPLGDVNRYYSGNFKNPVIANRDRLFFTPGASGRMSELIPTRMLNTYTYGPPFFGTTASLYSPVSSASIGFTRWLNQDRNTITLSGTHRGAQNLYFSNNWKPGPNYRSVLEIGEQWTPFVVDRNADGFADNSMGTSVSAHHQFGYDPGYSDTSRLSSVSNELFFHFSDLAGGQYKEGVYTTKDRAVGFYVSPEMEFSFRSNHTLVISSSYAYAALDNAWGVDRFHLNSSLISANAEYGHYGYPLTFQAGVNGTVATGEERWNNLRFSSGFQSASGFAKLSLNRYIWNLSAGVTGTADNVNGGVILPNAEVRLRLEKFNAWVKGSRYRSTPFAIGELLPLFYSSRQLQVEENPGTNQGWFCATGMNFSFSKLWIGASYNLSFQEHAVIIDTDSDADKILVYGATNAPAWHRLRGSVEYEFNSRFEMKAEYFVSVYEQNYDGATLQYPLLPVHRSTLSADWLSRRESLSAIAQICYTGAQRLPQYGWTPDYLTVNMLWKYKFPSQRIEVFLNGFNLLDYRQKSVIMGYDAGGEQYDGWMIWAPVTGRSFQAGVSLKF